jgi:hypothetical protein
MRFFDTIYQRNVFPDLGVKWGTYTSNLGHADNAGCFRSTTKIRRHRRRRRSARIAPFATTRSLWRKLEAARPRNIPP